MSKCTCKNNLKFYNDFIDFEGRTENSINDYADGTSFGRVEAIRNIKKVESLHAGNGLILDIIYRVRTKTYAVNNRNSALAWAKKAWERSIKENDSLNNIEFYYKTYVNELNKELKVQGGY
jgi:hypothetical protein